VNENVKIQLESLNEVLATQLNAFCLYVDMSYHIFNIIGDATFLGLSNIKLFTNIFDNFPKPISEGVLQNIQRNLRTNVTEKSEIHYIAKNREPKKVEIITSLITSGKESFYFITFLPLSMISGIDNRIIRDHESYKEAKRQLEFSENRYNSFFENDPVMHFSVNPATGFITDCNKYAINKLRINSKEEIIGKPIYTIYTKEKKDRCLFLIEKFKKEGYLDNEEMEIQPKTGESIPVILYTTAQRDENGKVLVSRSTLVDISELKNTQKRLNQKRMRLENMNTELEQFISTCSHDLQEPLATIKFANDLIDKLYGKKLNDTGRGYIRYVDEAVDRLTSQIRSLLSHIQIGQNAERTTVDTHELLKTVIKDLGNSITNSKAQVDILNTLPIIEAYEVELRLLFQNLLSNAIKYSKKGEIPKIEIYSFSNKDFTFFSVKDNGIGISTLDQKEIFKIFNRINHESPNKGDGVGLAHCKKIIKMHEGDITIESELGKGSVFTVKLKKNYIL